MREKIPCMSENVFVYPTLDFVCLDVKVWIKSIFSSELEGTIQFFFFFISITVNRKSKSEASLIYILWKASVSPLLPPL